MKVQNYIIKFAHPRPETHCIIEGNSDVFKGISRCSEKDIFCKDTGRKVALKKALKESNLTKEERSEVWEEYRNMTDIPRW